MNELHNNMCMLHSDQRTIASQVLRAKYYWSTWRKDCVKYVKKYKSCQEN